MSRLWSNEKLLTKAAITSASFTGGIGLSQEEADRFLDFVIDESVLKEQARVVRMNKATTKIDKIAFASNKVLKPGVAATDPGETVSLAAPTQILLEAKEMVAVVQISDDSLEDNIEGDAFADHVMRMVAAASSNQVEQALLLGRKLPTGTPTDVNQLWDGWLKLALAGGHVVDAAAGFTNRKIELQKYSELVKALPNKFRKNKSALRLYQADDISQDWADILAARGTVLGDQATTGEGVLRYRSIPMVSIGLLPIDQPIPVTGGGVENSTANEPIGETVIAVADTTGFTAGETVTLNLGGPKEESHVIASVQANTSLTLADGLVFAQDSGTVITETTVDATFSLLSDPRNLIWGVQRDVTIETERRARLRATDWVISMRMTANLENADATAVLKNLIVA